MGFLSSLLIIEPASAVAEFVEMTKQREALSTGSTTAKGGHLDNLDDRNGQKGKFIKMFYDRK